MRFGCSQFGRGQPRRGVVEHHFAEWPGMSGLVVALVWMLCVRSVVAGPAPRKLGLVFPGLFPESSVSLTQ